MKASDSRPDGPGNIATNRKARRDYFILETWEAGIELRGSEVKSVRARNVSLDESHAEFRGRELYLLALHVQPYACSHHIEHDPVRPKRLLLHRREIEKLIGHLALKGLTLIPLRLYLNNRGIVKVELALGRGKHFGDKRETLKRKTSEREAERAMAESRKR